MRNTFINTLLGMAKKDKDITLITGDLGYGVLTEFWETLPNQFINAGICEQNMTSVATGMALEGACTYTYSIANFPTLRCIEQIRNDACYHKANVNIVSVGAGFAYGSMGMSHHATEDMAIMRALPGITIFTPCDPYETKEATIMSRNIQGPCYIRLGKGGEKNLHMDQQPMKLGKAIQLRGGEDTVIFSCGAITSEAIRASDILANKGIFCSVYSFPTIKPIDHSLINYFSNKVKTIYTLEEHNIIGGFGSAICEVSSCSYGGARIIRLGINDEYVSIVGDQQYLRDYCGISAQKIANLIQMQADKL